MERNGHKHRGIRQNRHNLRAAQNHIIENMPGVQIQEAIY